MGTEDNKALTRRSGGVCMKLKWAVRLIDVLGESEYVQGSAVT
jgi:hypothetical protein